MYAHQNRFPPGLAFQSRSRFRQDLVAISHGRSYLAQTRRIQEKYKWSPPDSQRID